MFQVIQLSISNSLFKWKVLYSCDLCYFSSLPCLALFFKISLVRFHFDCWKQDFNCFMFLLSRSGLIHSFFPLRQYTHEEYCFHLIDLVARSIESFLDLSNVGPRPHQIRSNYFPWCDRSYQMPPSFLLFDHLVSKRWTILNQSSCWHHHCRNIRFPRTHRHHHCSNMTLPRTHRFHFRSHRVHYLYFHHQVR